MKFIALYLAPTPAIDEMMAKSTPEQMKAGMEAWMTWMKDHQDALVEFGAPLGKNKRVTGEGIASVRNEVTGYTIVWADSQDEAAELFEEHPHLQIPGAYIDVLPVMPIPGM